MKKIVPKQESAKENSDCMYSIPCKIVKYEPRRMVTNKLLFDFIRFFFIIAW